MSAHSEADIEWALAFEHWYDTAHPDEIVDCLKENIPLSSANARFLAAYIAGEVKAPSGRQARATAEFHRQQHIDEFLSANRKKLTRVEMLDQLQAMGLMHDDATLDAVDSHLKRATDRSSRFPEEYERITGEVVPLR